MKMALQFVRKLFLIKSTSNAQLSTTSSLLSKLTKTIELPDKPKRPATSFLRYLQDYRTNIPKPVSQKENLNISRVASEKWRAFSDEQKLKYEKEFEKAKEVYLKNVAAYEATLTEDQLVQIQENKAIKRIAGKKKAEKESKQKAGQPRRPKNAYLLFLAEEYKKKPGIAVPQLAISIGDNWHKLGEKEKEPYLKRAEELRENYRKELIVWEDKMYTNGNVKFIRKSALARKIREVKQKKPKRQKSKQE